MEASDEKSAIWRAGWEASCNWHDSEWRVAVAGADFEKDCGPSESVVRDAVNPYSARMIDADEPHTWAPSQCPCHPADCGRPVRRDGEFDLCDLPPDHPVHS